MGMYGHYDRDCSKCRELSGIRGFAARVTDQAEKDLAQVCPGQPRYSETAAKYRRVHQIYELIGTRQFQHEDSAHV